ncbi:MAG: undecaprenyldiphospho-muramoylpentapeptide beta-N-acetylglucosaminyltransferase [Legionellaceae bacterium]|nr:undecaprenyldiphospho-muramoylpentapeptide beta-N-acetylglucosaminyltransferase [Legionellaceae bacterium]
MNKHVLVFTGGGTAGHVTPNLALIHELASEYDIHYIGSNTGVERKLVESEGIAYHAVQSGKLRRHFSLKTALTPFKLLLGIFQSYKLLHKLKPKLVFSKGGFVALPVVIGAWLNRIPVIAHESDLSPGLANKLSFPFVNTVCVTFDAGKKYFKDLNKVHVTGTPIRPELLQGNREAGLNRCGFGVNNKPCILVIGGSQGAQVLNTSIRAQLDDLCTRFNIIHLCGAGKLDASLNSREGYFQLEYATQELPDLFAASDIILSRSGANALYEVLALEKPHVLVPLSRRYSRGDQIDNARYFEKKGVSVVLDEENMTSNDVRDALDDVYARRDLITAEIKRLSIQSATQTLVDLIRTTAKPHAK